MKIQLQRIINKISILMCLLALAVISVSAQNVNSLPVLRGDKAVEQLKQRGQYDSLLKTVTAERRKSGQTEAGNFLPVFGQSAKLTAFDGLPQDQLGSDVAVDGDTAIVGASLDDFNSGINQGSAYIFVRSGNTWTFQQKLTASDPANNNYFGNSVSISGNTVIVSAYANGCCGAVYVFVRSGTNWTQQQKLTASDGAAIDLFGWSVSISGDTLIAGAPDATVGGNPFLGAAYVFVRSGTIWSQQQKLVAPDGAERFGRGVAIDGDTAVVGAPEDDTLSNNRGSAYIFVRSGTNWTNQQKLTASDGEADDKFGDSVAISGNTVLVGDQLDKIGTNERQGSAYVFERSGTSWAEQQKLIASDGTANKRFGNKVAIDGDLAVIGSFLDNAAYIMARSGNTWTEHQKLSAGSGNFGWSVAIDGTTIIVGDISNFVGQGSNQGAAFVFTPLRSGKPFDFDGDSKSDISVFRPSTGGWYISQSSNGAFYGALFGFGTDQPVPADYDGDGKTDLAVFRPSNGTWYLQQSTNGFKGINFGQSGDIPVAADYDGDGKADIAVYRPSTGGWYRLNSSNNQFYGVQFGAPEDKPTLGDFDGDGKSDIAVFRPSNGAWYRLNSSDNSFYGTLFGFGTDKPVPADFDGDGKTDIAVYRASDGGWYRLHSSTNSFAADIFGASEDKPVPADYDGDAKADVAVFRPSNGTWYLLRSTSGFAAQPFGSSEDIPTPNAFLR